MKILIALTRAFNPNDAGVQRTTYKLGKYFTEQGLSVAYFSTKVTGHVAVDYGTLFPAVAPGDLGHPANRAALTRCLTEWKPDIVINQMPYDVRMRDILAAHHAKGGYILIGCLRNSLFNFISDVGHNVSEHLPAWVFRLINHPLGLGLIKQYHRIKHARALRAILDIHDCYVLLSPPNRDELRYFVGDYQAHKVAVVPNSIPAVFPDARHHKEKMILYVGSLNTQQKRADLLLPFWQRVCDQLPDWRFIIVGQGPYGQTIEAQIAAQGIPRVELAGYQRPEPYYTRASLFVMPSAYEGFPNTILEAHSHACPVLAFNSYAALPWIVNDGQDAALFPPYDVDQMAEQCIALAGAPAKLETMQTAALDNARRFTIDGVGMAWMDLFKQLGA